MKRSLSFFSILLFSIIFLGIGCDNNSEHFSFQLPERDTSWQIIDESIQLREFPIELDNTTIELTVYKFDSSDFTASIHNDQPKRFNQWSTELDSHLLINGGFFDEANNPTGWLVIDGNEIGSNRYSPDVSGMLLIKDGVADISDANTIDQIELTSKISLLQSFPLLIRKGGIANIEKDSEKIARRTVIAKNTTGEFLVILVDQTPVSLYTLMRALIASDLEIDIALNLDGGPSSGLIASINEHEKGIIPLTPLPQIVRFLKHPPVK